MTLIDGAFLGGPSPVAAADDPTPPYRITTKHQADRVTVAAETDRTVITVRSPGGIGDATIERPDAEWPAKLLVRLHLRGLEELRISNGTTTLGISVASSSQTPPVRVWKGDRETSPLGPRDRLWIDVRMLDEKRQPTKVIPLKAGWFELALPPALLEPQPKAITLRWIDFHR